MPRSKAIGWETPRLVVHWMRIGLGSAMQIHSHQTLARTFLALVLCAALWPTAPANAILYALSDFARVRLGRDKIPDALVQGDFTVFAWVWRESSDDTTRAIIQHPELFDLLVEGRDRVRLTFHVAPPSLGTWGTGPSLGRSSAAVSQVHLVLPGELPIRQWTLIAVTFDRSLGRFDLLAQGAEMPVRHATATAPTLIGAVFGPLTGDLVIGGDFSRYRAFRGAYGPIVVRRHAITQRDFTEVFESRRFFAAWDHVNHNTGGRMRGPPDCVLMVNAVMSTSPNDAGVGVSSAPLRASVVGRRASVTNFHMWDQFFLASGQWTERLRSVHPMAGVFDFVYASHRDSPFDGWFVSDLPAATLEGDRVAGWAPHVRKIFEGLDGPLRVMVSANSRAVGRFDGSGVGNGNYAHGLIEALRPRVSGVMFRPADVSGLDTHVWFGFETNRDPPRRSVGESVVVLQSVGPPLNDFSRTFTLSTGTTPGPGSGLLLRPGGWIIKRCRPESDTLVRADGPLHVEAIVLKYPGSSAAIWRWDRGPTQSGLGVRGKAMIRALDTTQWVRTLGGGDRMLSGNEMELAGSWASHLQAGMMACVTGGTAAGASSVIETVVEDVGVTRITFEHPFGESPGQGSTVHFGPWGFEVLAHDFVAVSPGDPNQWRGLEVRAEQGSGLGVVLLAYSAWRDDVPGIIVGSTGQGGTGYSAQFAGAYREAPRKWIALTRADVWLVAPAQQGSTPDTIHLMTAAVADALPRADIVWAGDMAHSGNPGEPWHRYILDEARASDVVGLAPLMDPRLGSFHEQLADGMRSDGAHLSLRGATTLAKVWLDLVDLATADPCAALDFVPDGRLDALDMAEFMARHAVGHRSADLDRSGFCDIVDVMIFMKVYENCQ